MYITMSSLGQWKRVGQELEGQAAENAIKSADALTKNAYALRTAAKQQHPQAAQALNAQADALETQAKTLYRKAGMSYGGSIEVTPVPAPTPPTPAPTPAPSVSQERQERRGQLPQRGLSLPDIDANTMIGIGAGIACVGLLAVVLIARR